MVNLQKTLSVIIPAHNEEGCIEKAVRDITSKLSEQNIIHEVLVVNDHSKDSTEDILKKLSEEIESVRYINNEGKNGYGYTVICGLNNFSGDYAAVMMADGSDTSKDLIVYYNKIIEGYDCVFGTRFSKDSIVVDYPFLKLVFNRLGNLLIQVLFQSKYNDFTNAFKMFSRDTIEGLKPFLSHTFNLTLELPLKAVIRGYNYVIVPNGWYNRTSGVSKFKVGELSPYYFFIIFYCLLEKLMLRKVYHKKSK